MKTPNPTLDTILNDLQQAARDENAQPERFFKIDGYSAHDQFLGVKVPTLRKLAKTYAQLSLVELQKLLESPFNEARALALFVLVTRYTKAPLNNKDDVYAFYVANLRYVNNWNLVDASCRDIMGAHLSSRDRSPLKTLAQSNNLWERRIAIVSTWYFIRNNDFAWTFIIAEMLLNDREDLIHKAAGWMLREVGDKDHRSLTTFLDKHAPTMPRTMLRYAIEKFPEPLRKEYLVRTAQKKI